MSGLKVPLQAAVFSSGAESNSGRLQRLESILTPQFPPRPSSPPLPITDAAKLSSHGDHAAQLLALTQRLDRRLAFAKSTDASGHAANSVQAFDLAQEIDRNIPKNSPTGPIFLKRPIERALKNLDKSFIGALRPKAEMELAATKKRRIDNDAALAQQLGNEFSVQSLGHGMAIEKSAKAKALALEATNTDEMLQAILPAKDDPDVMPECLGLLRELKDKANQLAAIDPQQGGYFTQKVIMHGNYLLGQAAQPAPPVVPKRPEFAMIEQLTAVRPGYVPEVGSSRVQAPTSMAESLQIAPHADTIQPELESALKEELKTMCEEKGVRLEHFGLQNGKRVFTPELKQMFEDRIYGKESRIFSGFADDMAQRRIGSGTDIEKTFADFSQLAHVGNWIEHCPIEQLFNADKGKGKRAI